MRASRNGLLQRVFLDLNLHDGPGLDRLSALKAALPKLPVALISGDRIARNLIEQALALGAMGFVPESEDADTIIAALRCAPAGGVFLPAHLTSGRPGYPLLTSISPDSMPGAGSIAAAVDTVQLGITKRQTEVLRCVVQGWPKKPIASKLGISVSVVKKPVSDLLAHLQVVSRIQLGALIAAQGIPYGPPEHGGAGDHMATN